MEEGLRGIVWLGTERSKASNLGIPPWQLLGATALENVPYVTNDAHCIYYKVVYEVNDHWSVCTGSPELACLMPTSHV